METTDKDKTEDIGSGKSDPKKGGRQGLGSTRAGCRRWSAPGPPDGSRIPDWIFSWQILLIVIGIFSGLAHAFRGPGWLIMILIGTFFLMDHLIPGLDIHRFIWPAVIIVVGLIMLIRPKKPYWMEVMTGDRYHNGRHRQRWQRKNGKEIRA